MEAIKSTLFGVVPHCEGKKPTGRGLVVREYVNGQCTDHYNYGGVEPIKLYKSRAAAWKYAGGKLEPAISSRRFDRN